MRQLDLHAAREHLRLLEHLLDSVDRAIGDAGFVEQLDPFAGRLEQEHRIEQRGDFLPVLHTLPVGRVARVLRQVRAICHVTELVKQVVVATRQNQCAVGRPERLVGHDIGMRIADGLG